jgi:hypothetical protein
MKNAGIAGGLVAIGIGLATIGLSNFSRTANAVPAAALPAGPGESQIVWYDMTAFPVASGNAGITYGDYYILSRAWSDGTVEMKVVYQNEGCSSSNTCDWVEISSATEGLNAAADINLDEIVDGADLGMLLASWGAAPRGPVPLSDCPLGLIQ